MAFRADQRGRLRLDQLLQHHLHGGTNDIDPVGSVQGVEQVKQGRLGQGHRVFSFVEFLGGYSRSLTRWPLNAEEAGPELHHSTGRDLNQIDSNPHRFDILNILSLIRRPAEWSPLNVGDIQCPLPVRVPRHRKSSTFP